MCATFTRLGKNLSWIRTDNLLRSALYAHFAESLTGLASIRAYGETKRFIHENERLLDVENRAYYLTVINQRWLGLRLDFFGSVLVFAVAIISVGTRYSLSPSEIGVALSYIISVQQAFSWSALSYCSDRVLLLTTRTVVRQIAEVENDMASLHTLQTSSSVADFLAEFVRTTHLLHRLARKRSAETDSGERASCVVATRRRHLVQQGRHGLSTRVAASAQGFVARHSRGREDRHRRKVRTSDIICRYASLMIAQDGSGQEFDHDQLGASAWLRR